jgi:hypothetical protein
VQWFLSEIDYNLHSKDRTSAETQQSSSSHTITLAAGTQSYKGGYMQYQLTLHVYDHAQALLMLIHANAVGRPNQLY